MRSDDKLAYVDVFTPMLDAAGQPRRELFLEDGLHMNASGYAIWRDGSPHTSIAGDPLQPKQTINAMLRIEADVGSPEWRNGFVTPGWDFLFTAARMHQARIGPA